MGWAVLSNAYTARDGPRWPFQRTRTHCPKFPTPSRALPLPRQAHGTGCCRRANCRRSKSPPAPPLPLEPQAAKHRQNHTNTEAPMPGGGPPVQSRRTKPQRPRQWHGSSAARVCRAAEAARSGHQPSPPPPSRGLTIRSYSGLAVRPPNRVASPLPSPFHLYTGRGSHGLARTRAEVVVAAAVLVKLDGTV